MMPIKEYSKTRNLSLKLVRRLITTKQLPATKLFERWYVYEEEADNVLKERCLANMTVERSVNTLSMLKRNLISELASL